MLERYTNTVAESYTYTGNVISMTRSAYTKQTIGIDVYTNANLSLSGKDNLYYPQDELGSTMYMTGIDGIAFDTYAYDEFGRSLDNKIYEKNTWSSKRKSYSKNGNILQPFAFTGYQYDEISENYFAQARYYDEENGRFTAEDQVRGYINAPDTQNHYLYCINSPINLVDKNGMWPQFISNTIDNVGDFIGNKVTTAGTFVCNTVDTISDFVDEHENQIKGTAIIAGTVVASVALTSTGHPVLASAALSAGIDWGTQVFSGQEVNKKEIAVAAVSGAICSFIPAASEVAVNSIVGIAEFGGKNALRVVVRIGLDTLSGAVTSIATDTIAYGKDIKSEEVKDNAIYSAGGAFVSSVITNIVTCIPVKKVENHIKDLNQSKGWNEHVMKSGSYNSAYRQLCRTRRNNLAHEIGIFGCIALWMGITNDALNAILGSISTKKIQECGD